MSVGLGKAVADLIVAAKWRISGASATGMPAAPFYAMLHSGDPGPLGTANTINSARRVQLSGAATGQMVSSGATTGQAESTGDTVWVSAADGAPNVRFMSVWGGAGAATNPGGTLIHTGPCIGSYSIGDNPTIFAGDFTDAAVIVA